MIWAIIIACFVTYFRVTIETIPAFQEKNPVLRQYEYEYKAEKEILKEEYEKSLLPKSGYMLKEDYERNSVGLDNYNREIEEKKYPKPADMKYVPQPTYKLVRYNNPAGTVELNVPRKVGYERQVNTQGVVSGDFKKMVYSSVYYYPRQRCTSCDTFVIPLDESLNRLERVQKANVIKKNPEPIFSTSKDITQEGAYRTITPIDYSEDNNYILAKEKTGYIFDGIWKTEVLVHNFTTGKSKKLTEARETIIDYWHNVSGVEFDDYRWDIYPLGFDRNDNTKILISGYAYTGGVPVFLGTWSVDINGERTQLIDLEGSNYPVSIVGYKMVQDSVVPREEVEWEAKRQAKLEKKSKKLAKKELRKENRAKKKQYKHKLKELKAQHQLRVEMYKKSNKSGLSGVDGPIEIQHNIDNKSIDENTNIKNINNSTQEYVEKK